MAESRDLIALHDRLDVLWARYLNLLDEYTSAQAAIKKDMATGFFSLTQANFKSPGRRYGQDYYDERAVATVRMNIEAKGEAIGVSAVRTEVPIADSAVDSIDSDKNDASVSDKEGTISKESNQTHLPSPSPTPEPQIKGEDPKQISDEKDHNDNKSFEATTSSSSKPKIDTHDPIRWFGILVPPALRQAQKSFLQAVQNDNGISQAANSARGLRETETEIRKLRKLLRKAERDASAAKDPSS